MSRVDTERFRLRRFVEELVAQGECAVHDAPIDLVDLASQLDCNEKAVWFRAAGPERAPVVGNVMGSRRRLALALGSDDPGFPALLRARVAAPVRRSRCRRARRRCRRSSSRARRPISARCRRISSTRSTALPTFPPASISPAIPATVHQYWLPPPDAARPAEAGIDLNAPSDLRAIYRAAAARERAGLPSPSPSARHPADFLAARRHAGVDELDIIGAIRATARW